MNRKRWKIFSAVALTVALAIFIAGFFIVKDIYNNMAGPAPSRITSRIIKEMNYTDLVEVSPSQLSKHYSIPNGVITDSSLYMSKSSDNASELACFLLVDKSKFEDLKVVIIDHINSKAAGYKSLNPAQYNLLKNYVIVQNGRYVLVSVGNNASEDEKYFTKILK